MRKAITATILTLFAFCGSAHAKSYSLGSTGFDLSGDLAITFRTIDRHTPLNQNFHGDDPFSPYRARMFIQKSWNENIQLALEFLWDSNAAPRVQGAYFTFSNLLGSEFLYAKVGLIPAPFGNYGWRSTYFNQNPLIGVPMFWHWKTPLPGDGRADNAELFELKAEGARSLPPGYDACWDTGISLHYDRGILESTVAFTQGTMSNPRAAANDGYQGIAKVGLDPLTGLKFGGSAAIGAWIYPTAPTSTPYSYESNITAGIDPLRETTSDYTYPYPKSVDSYLATIYGGYLEYSVSYWQFFSEFAWEQWQTPFLNEKSVDLTTGYLEARYKLNAKWYVAGRVDALRYGKILNPTTNTKETWGYDVNRFEVALGYRVIREGFIRLDYQSNNYIGDSHPDPVNILALQFLFAF